MTKSTKSTNPNKLTEEERKSSKALSAMQRRASRRKNRGDGEVADWSGVDGDAISHLINVIASLGGTVTFGYTRDGGAYYINYYIGGEQDKVYIRPSEDIDASLAYEADSFSV